jgi:hypothetical protein
MARVLASDQREVTKQARELNASAANPQDADDMMFDAVLAEILTAPTKLGQSNCMAMQMDSNTDSSGNLAMLLGDMELKNRPASCTISNPASMSSFSTAVDSSQSVCEGNSVFVHSWLSGCNDGGLCSIGASTRSPCLRT